MNIEENLNVDGLIFFGQNQHPYVTKITFTAGYYPGEDGFKMTVKQGINQWSELTFTPDQIKKIIQTMGRALRNRDNFSHQKTDQ